MFGTDYPQEIRGQDKVKVFIEGIRSLDLSKEDVEAILGGNAARVLGI